MAAERASSGRERGRKGATRAAPSRKQYNAVVDEDDLEYGGGGEESSTSCRRCCLAGAATSALLLAGVVAAYGYRAQLLGLYHGAAARLAAPAAGASTAPVPWHPPPQATGSTPPVSDESPPPPPPTPATPAPPPSPPDLECYAARYPDLLDGFCGGAISDCDWTRLKLHFEEHGRAEGRTFACSANPPSPPAPRPPPSLVVKASSVPHPCARLSTPAASAARLQLLESPPHAVDVADGMEHGWIYVDNVKSGSTTVLQRTMATGTWCHGAVVDGVGCTQHFNATLTAPRTCCSTGDRACSRLSTRCLRRADAQRLLLFSFVRDPVAKFESGLRQFYHDDPGAEKLGADAILRKQLAADHWLNEHLQPSWWRLCGADADGQFLPLDYVGRLESFEEDWNRIVKLMPGADAKLRSHYTRPLSAANRRTVGNTSVLSDEGRRLFCRSGLYGEEYAFLRRLDVPYELPSACAN